MNSIELLKKKILYRCEYRGIKEMELLLRTFAKKHIDEFNIAELKQLDHLLNFDDDNLFKWYSNKKSKIKAITKDDYYITLNKKDIRHLKVYLEYDGPVKAPIQKDQKIANLIVSDKDEIVTTLPLYASEKISKVNFFKSLITSLNYLVWGDV